MIIRAADCINQTYLKKVIKNNRILCLFLLLSNQIISLSSVMGSRIEGRSINNRDQICPLFQA